MGSRSSRNAVFVVVALSWLHLSGAPALEGRWRLDKISIDRLQGMSLGRPFIQTEVPPPGSYDQSRIIDVAGDIVTVVTNSGLGFPATPTTERYQVDGRAHRFEWGDALPLETAVRTASWNQDGNGLLLEEVYRETERQTHRWTVSQDGQVLTVETTYDRPCPPCKPGVLRIVRTFARQL